MSKWVILLSNGSPDYAMYRAVNSALMMAADKKPGVRPLACGEIYMRLWGRCNLAAETRNLARDACGNIQACAGLKAGIEGMIHSVRAIWPESAGWTFDQGADAEPANLFQQLLDGTERELASAGANEDPELALEEEEVDPGAAEYVDLAQYERNSGYGALMVDARNAFNEKNRYLMLWNVYHRWHRGSRLTFNRYRHQNIIYVRGLPGEMPVIILGKEGVAQGCVFGSICFGIGLMPLAEKMREEVPEALQPLFADDVTPVGPAGPNARCLKFLCDNGPRYGYFPEPEKSFYVCKGEDESVARMAFAGFGFGADVLKFVRGHRYLGSYIGSGTLKEDYINDKVTTWVSAIEVLAKLAVKYPQAVYAGYTFCLQGEWQFLCRCTPGIAHLMQPMEHAIRTHLLPSFLGIDAVDVDIKFRELLALAAKRGGLGIRNPMATAEDYFNTSMDACSYLVGTLVNREPFDQVRHKGHIAEAVTSAQKVRMLGENDILERKARGNPTEKRRYKKALQGTGMFLTAIPNRLNGTILSAEQWRDNVRLLYNLEPLNMPSKCDGCGAKLTVDHALSCKKGGLVHMRHDDIGGEIRWLASCALSHSRVEREPYINSSVGRRAREIAAAATQQPPTPPPVTPLQQQPTQPPRRQNQPPQQCTPTPIDEKRGDVGIHGFWERGRLCIFDIRVTDTDARSYRHKDPMKVLEAQEQEKKDKYLSTCHELHKDFTPMVYSVDGMAGREARMAEKRLASYLANKWHRPYSQMVPFVRLRIRMSIARSNSLLLRGSRDREPARPFIQCGSALHERQTVEGW